MSMILPIITWFFGPLHYVLWNILKVTPHTQSSLFQITNGDHCKQACVSGFIKTCITLNKVCLLCIKDRKNNPYVSIIFIERGSCTNATFTINFFSQYKYQIKIKLTNCDLILVELWIYLRSWMPSYRWTHQAVLQLLDVWYLTSR